MLGFLPNATCESFIPWGAKSGKEATQWTSGISQLCIHSSFSFKKAAVPVPELRSSEKHRQAVQYPSLSLTHTSPGFSSFGQVVLFFFYFFVTNNNTLIQWAIKAKNLHHSSLPKTHIINTIIAPLPKLPWFVSPSSVFMFCCSLLIFFLCFCTVANNKWEKTLACQQNVWIAWLWLMIFWVLALFVYTRGGGGGGGYMWTKEMYERDADRNFV